jgi:hypothetical protein
VKALHNSIVDLRLNPFLVYADARSTRAAGLRGFTAALNQVSFTHPVLFSRATKKPPSRGLPEP